MNKYKKRTTIAKKIGWIGLTMCGICCALPIIGGIIGITSLTIFSFYLEKFGILILGLSVALFWYNWYNNDKKVPRRPISCDNSCKCKSEHTL